MCTTPIKFSIAILANPEVLLKLENKINLLAILVELKLL